MVSSFLLLPVAAFANPTGVSQRFLRGTLPNWMPDVASQLSLPPCPASIYDGFCSRTNLAGGGVACLSSMDEVVTAPEEVQCVPADVGSYRCPDHLPVKCDARQAPTDHDLVKPSQVIEALCAGIGGSCPDTPYQVSGIYGLIGTAGGAIDGRGLDCSRKRRQPCIAFAFVTLPDDIATMLNNNSVVGCNGTTASQAVCDINNFVGIPTGEYQNQSYTTFSGKVTNRTANTSLDTEPVDIIVPTWQQLGQQYLHIIDFVFGKDERLKQCGNAVHSSVFGTLQRYTEGTLQFENGFADFYTTYGTKMEQLGGKCNTTQHINNGSTKDEIEDWGSTCRLTSDDNSNSAFLGKILKTGEGLCNSVEVARMILWIYGDCNQEFMGTGYNPGGKEGIVLPNQNVPQKVSTMSLGDAVCV